jgi:hypothetical protein
MAGVGGAILSFSHFDSTKITVLNRALAPDAAAGFITEGLWDKVLADMKRGDFVLIQFGHNDGGAVNDASRPGSLPGLGEETQEIDNLVTKQRSRSYLRLVHAQDDRRCEAKGATPIALVNRAQHLERGKVERGSGHFGRWAAEIAKSQRVVFIDVTKIIADRYESLGERRSKNYSGLTTRTPVRRGPGLMRL